MQKKEFMNWKIRFRILCIFWDEKKFFSKLVKFWTIISQKLKIGKLIFHLFQHIAQLSCRYGHFWTITIFFSHFCSVTHLKFVNTIKHNSKNINHKNLKNRFFILYNTVGIFHVNMATFEEGVYISLIGKNLRLVSNQSANGKYNLISVWYNKKLKKLSLCVSQ